MGSKNNMFTGLGIQSPDKIIVYMETAHVCNLYIYSLSVVLSPAVALPTTLLGD